MASDFKVTEIGI